MNTNNKEAKLVIAFKDANNSANDLKAHAIKAGKLYPELYEGTTIGQFVKAQPKAGGQVRLALAEIYKNSEEAIKRGHDIFEAGELSKIDCASNDELKVKYGLDVYENVLVRKSTTEGARQACGDHARVLFNKMLKAIKEDNAKQRGEQKGPRATKKTIAQSLLDDLQKHSVRIAKAFKSGKIDKATFEKAEADIVTHAKSVKSNEGLETFTV